MEEFVKSLPKAELHLHIEGSLEPELMFKLAKKNQVSIPYKSVQEVRAAYNFHNLQSFLDIYYAGAGVLVHEQDFYDLAWEYLMRCKADGVTHTEIFFDPQTHTERGIKFETFFYGFKNALEDANKDFGITSHMIMCFLRHLSEDEAQKTLDECLPFKDHIIGVGLDSSEKGHPPTKFKNVFARARKEGFKAVAHAGEEGDASYIREAVEVLGVERIDHGVRILEDQAVVDLVKERNIPLTVCPYSNVKLCVFDKLENHNLKKLMDAGLKVTINSDDPAYFGGYLNENIIGTANALNLSEDEIKLLCQNSIDASFT